MTVTRNETGDMWHVQLNNVHLAYRTPSPKNVYHSLLVICITYTHRFSVSIKEKYFYSDLFYLLLYRNRCGLVGGNNTAPMQAHQPAHLIYGKAAVIFPWFYCRLKWICIYFVVKSSLKWFIGEYSIVLIVF